MTTPKPKKPKQFRVKLAFGFYAVGAVITPTGVYRDELLANGFIEPLETDGQATPVAGKKPKRPRKAG